MSNLENLFKKHNTKLTENGDVAFHSVGSNYADIIFKTAYLEHNLDKVPVLEGNDIDRIFAMFIRDPRKGMGRRDLGRHLMKQTNLSPELAAIAGRYDDLIYLADGDPKSGYIKHVVEKAQQGDHLAKKWLPRTTGKDREIALAIAKEYGLDSNWNKGYRELIKTDTVEHKLSECKKKDGEVIHHLLDSIEFDKVPSLAMMKHYSKFTSDPRLEARFEEYLKQVDKGEKKLNVSTTTFYDIYKNRYKINPDLFIAQMPKIEMNCIPILDTSWSMADSKDSIGKATAIAHALALGSTYEEGKVVSFSSRPKLIDIYGEKNEELNDLVENYEIHTMYEEIPKDFFNTEYFKQISRMYTGDISHTDFGRVMELLSKLDSYPEYLVVLSDMEFDYGSAQSKDEAMQIIQSKSPNTKIIWWNFYSNNDAVPETDDYGNIFMSGYNPQLLTLLEVGFNMDDFIKALLADYLVYLKGIYK